MKFKGTVFRAGRAPEPLCITISEPFERDGGGFRCHFLCEELMRRPCDADGVTPEKALATAVMQARAFLKGFGGIYRDEQGREVQLPSSKDFDPDFPVEDDDFSPPDEERGPTRNKVER